VCFIFIPFFAFSDEPDTGRSSEDKIAKLREEMTKQKAKVVVVSALDEIAWLFNLRGSDIEYNPGENSFQNLISSVYQLDRKCSLLMLSSRTTRRHCS
jgi:Cdc6-like AAA superfamily ATPase